MKINPVIRSFAISSLIVGITYFLNEIISTIYGLSLLGHIDSGFSESERIVTFLYTLLFTYVIPLISLLVAGYITGIIIKMQSWLYAGIFGVIWAVLVYGGAILSIWLQRLQKIGSSQLNIYPSKDLPIVITIILVPMLGAFIQQYHKQAKIKE